MDERIYRAAMSGAFLRYVEMESPKFPMSDVEPEYFPKRESRPIRTSSSGMLWR